MCLEKLYKELTGNALQYTKFGKPEPNTYQYDDLISFATDVIKGVKNSLWPGMHGEHIVYAVGDNPASDIAGANQHGWESILVKTGVWSEADGHNHGATHVVYDVEEAVELALKKEGLI